MKNAPAVPAATLPAPFFEDLPGTPLDFSVLARSPVRRAPLLGEHTEEILAETLGLGEAEIGRLFDGGVVAGPSPSVV